MEEKLIKMIEAVAGDSLSSPSKIGEILTACIGWLSAFAFLAIVPVWLVLGVEAGEGCAVVAVTLLCIAVKADIIRALRSLMR